MSLPSEKEIYAALEMRIGRELLEKFRNVSVAVCGLGGLGSNISLALARAGISKIHLIDFDRVDLSNINRQQYMISQIGMKKTDAMRENILNAIPYCNIRTDFIKVSEDNLTELLKDDDIICEAFDNPECKAMLVNGVLEKFPDKYIVAASGMAGMDSPNIIKTRKITEHFYLCGDGVSDVSESTSLVCPRVMICAAHQAHTVLRIIANQTDKI